MRILRLNIDQNECDKSNYSRKYKKYASGKPKQVNCFTKGMKVGQLFIYPTLLFSFTALHENAVIIKE
tara:strand:+ start:3590 stop:3793 length:204 start_codon:yes stop_codon:yes gene_type:complete